MPSDSPFAPPSDPWATPAEGVVEALDTDGRSGLSRDEAERRLERHGPNRLRRIEHRSVWGILFDQVKSLVVLLLAAAAVVSASFGQWTDAGAIAVVVLINTAIGFFTELQARRSMEALQQMGEVEATVVRDGEERTLGADAIVPGDVLVLREGETVAADVRLVEVDQLQIDESALTGESVPIEKQTEPVETDAAMADRLDMAMRGTVATRGTARGVVVATGMDTELGAVSAMVEQAEGQDTPLEQRLDELARRLVWLTLVVAAVVAGAGLLAGRGTLQMIETGVALAVAAIPEGLPIVATIALARGVRRMLRRNALIRRLSSVETLGSTNVICTDKTGTLTENRMVVARLTADDRELDPRQEGSDGGENDPIQRALEIGLLCNQAHLGNGNESGDADENASPEEPAATTRSGRGPSRARSDLLGRETAWSPSVTPRATHDKGDPMELALLRTGRDWGVSREALLERYPEDRVEPFDRDTQMMATVHRQDGGFRIAIKGAPEAVLEASTSVLSGGEGRPLDDEQRRRWTERSEALATEGLRVLGLAERRVDSPETSPYEELCFVGLVGLLDPPRDTVPAAVAECRDAGIDVVMVTGDHPATARAIARQVGILDEGEEPDGTVIHGKEFDGAGDRLTEARVLARVSPRQKLQLIDAHRAASRTVAMTGDGVNDAPALKNADIGVAMGQRGTEVAREAADMVLLDDAFETITAAVRQGRIIFENIRKFVVYLLSGNVGEVLAVGIAALTAAPLPLLPLQILYLNMLNDVFPALALGVGPGTGEVMQQPPRQPEEPVIGRAQWAAIGAYGVVVGAMVLGAFATALYWLGFSEERAITVSFLTLSIGRLLHAFNMRSPATGIVDNDIVRNPWMWGAIALCVGLLLLAVYVPPLASVLSLTPPGLDGWAVVAVGSLVPLAVGQPYLLIRGARKG